MTDEEARAWLGSSVSRETMERLERFADLLSIWNARINLVAKASLAHLWSRHIVDSAQLAIGVEKEVQWIDLGSGAGLPGLVVAAILKEISPASAMTLVESDRRKVIFLQEAARAMDLSPSIRCERIETMIATGDTARHFDIVSARALAPLTTLLHYASPLLRADGVCLFPKGQSVNAEIDAVTKEWRLNITGIPSLTDPKSCILKISEIVHDI